MCVMLLFMFNWNNHDDAPQIGGGLSLENLLMFLLATPVQVNTIALPVLDQNTLDCC
jgi:hypothetical protein